jgi:hypothetical protein
VQGGVGQLLLEAGVFGEDVVDGRRLVCSRHGDDSLSERVKPGVDTKKPTPAL